MNKRFKAKWLKLLRSGEVPQARHQLRDGDALCCIGVGFLAEKGRKPGINAFTEDVATMIGLSDEHQRRLVNMNDSRRWGFRAIANWIEKTL